MPAPKRKRIEITNIEATGHTPSKENILDSGTKKRVAKLIEKSVLKSNHKTQSEDVDTSVATMISA